MGTPSRQVSKQSSRLLPLIDDPVITSALRSSVAHSRASSLHNLPIGKPEKKVCENPLRRWLTTLHRRSLKRRKNVQPRQNRWKLNEFENDPPSPASSRLFPPAPSIKHRKSTSWATGSTNLLAGTRSAFASMSILSEHRNSVSDGGASRLSKSCRSNRGSSMDVDTEAIHERSMKRRQVLDELIRTESEYILSLKALDTLHRSVNITATEPMKSDMDQMQKILGKLTDLHHELYHAIQNVRRPSQYVAKPTEAAGIAIVFEKFLNRFFLYEEYGSKYEDMLHNVGRASQNIPNWENYQRGFEMLNNSIIPQAQGDLGRKKSMTFGDLHIKRVCKYPLFFADLCKCTPVINGPDEHSEVEKVLFRLRDTVMEINQTTVDKGTRERMQRSWNLQDMLIFPDMLLAPHILRSLGHARLCGALYIAYRSSKSVTGEYMLCALFKSYLILASSIKQDGARRYRVVASIALANIKLHSADSEFGLQCLTAPNVWKILFEVDSAIFEVLAMASSVSEREKWMQAICENADLDTANHDQFSMIVLHTTSIGSVIGKPGSLLRSLAMKDIRAAKRQIVIRSTHPESPNSLHLTILERISHPVLIPKRSDWTRIEQDIESTGYREANKDDVSQRSRLLRESASTLLRKLSRSSKKQVNEAITS